MREFTQAEAQIFATEEIALNYPGFKEVSNLTFPFLTAKEQESGGTKTENISLEEAINTKILNKEAYAYCFFIAHKIFSEMGFSSENLRFRQHKSTEKAHYAHDAWDLEIKSSRFNWVECCGIHDRGTYDLSRHAQYAKEKFDIGPKNSREIPGVLEIAFGIERPLYLLLEQTYQEEKVKDEERTWFKFPPKIAPVKAAIFPLMKKDGLPKIAKDIYNDLLDRVSIQRK